ncbi:hypothetical protein OG21DRAFT_1515152 [Imleria badia]|nr:hypothetical protein OG21DRAFT_1515152 [Imleria badia]
MAISANSINWLPFLEDWDYSASDILNEQALEESIQKSVGALLMPTENTIVGWPAWDDGWFRTASDILSEEAAEEAQY